MLFRRNTRDMENRITLKGVKMAKPLSESLAELMYYDEGAKAPFEKLPKEEAEARVGKAARILLHLDQLNMEVIPVRKKEDEEKVRKQSLAELTARIKKFVSTLNTTKPALFPCEELACRILE